MSQDPSNWGQSKNDVDNWSKVGQTGDGGGIKNSEKLLKLFMDGPFVTYPSM